MNEKSEAIDEKDDHELENPRLVLLQGYMVTLRIKLKRKKWSLRYFVLFSSGELLRFKNEKEFGQKSKEEKIGKLIMVKGKMLWKSNFKSHCIRIDNHPKRPFYFFPPIISKKERKKKKKKDTTPPKRSEICQKWIVELSNAGGIFSGGYFIDDYLTPHIFKKTAKDWKSEHVVDWLYWLQIPQSAETLGDLYEEEFESVDGKSLLKLDNFSFRTKKHHEVFFNALDELKKNNNKFNPNPHIIRRKLNHLLHIMKPVTSPKFRIRDSELKKVLSNFSSIDPMCETYLSLKKDVMKIHDSVLQNTLIRTSEDDDEEEGEEGETNDSPELMYEPRIIESSPNSVRNDEDSALINPRFFYDGYHHVPIQLMVHSVPAKLNQHFKNDLSRLLSPIISDIPKPKSSKIDEYMKFRIGLVVGIWYFEWDESSIVIPRRIEGEFMAYFLSFSNSGLMKVRDRGESIVSKIAKVCVEYNTRKTYDGYTCNGIHFVRELLKHLKVTLDEGPFIRYLEHASQSGGEAGPILPLREDFMNTFRLTRLSNRERHVYYHDGVIDGKAIMFNSHREIDSFHRDAILHDPISIRMDFMEEYKLIQSFDFNFWYVHYHHPEIEIFKPGRDHNDKLKCWNKRAAFSFLRDIYAVYRVSRSEQKRTSGQNPKKSRNMRKVLRREVNNRIDRMDLLPEHTTSRKETEKMKAYTIHFHAFDWNKQAPKEIERIRLETEMIGCTHKNRFRMDDEYEKYTNMIYFGSPIHQIVATAMNSCNRIVVYSTLDFKTQKVIEVTGVPKIDQNLIVKWDKNTFLVGMYSHETQVIYIDSYSLRYYYNEEEDGVNHNLRCTRNFRLLEYVCREDLGGLTCILKLEKDLFMVETWSPKKLIFVSYSKKEILAEFSSRRDNIRGGITQSIISKLLPNSIISMSNNDISLIHYQSTSTTGRRKRRIFVDENRIPIYSEINVGVKKTRDGRDVKMMKKWEIHPNIGISSILNPYNLDEELIILGGKHQVLVIVLRHNKIDVFTSCEGIFFKYFDDNTLLKANGYTSDTSRNSVLMMINSVSRQINFCLGDYNGIFRLLHLDIEITTAGNENDINRNNKKKSTMINCEEYLVIRHHYDDITGIVLLDEEQRDGEQEEGIKIVTCSKDGYVAKTRLKGLAAFSRNRNHLNELQRLDLKERSQFLMLIEGEDLNILLKGVYFVLKLKSGTRVFTFKSFLLS